MNQEIKDKLEQAADALFEHKGYSFTPCDYAMRKGFLAGAQTILENPSGWGLVNKDSIAYDILNIERQNTRLREALERIYNDESMSAMKSWVIAKEALKQEEE